MDRVAKFAFSKKKYGPLREKNRPFGRSPFRSSSARLLPAERKKGYPYGRGELGGGLRVMLMPSMRKDGLS